MKSLLLALISTLAIAEIPKSEWTFKSETVREEYYTGLVPDPDEAKTPPSKDFLEQRAVIPNKFELSKLAELSPVKHQRSCGSCVAFAVSSVVEDSYRVRGTILPRLSQQYTMDCGKRQWMCNGSFFSRTADDYIILGGTLPLKTYPYVAVNQACKGKSNNTVGKILSYRIISNTPKSIAAALVSGYPVAVTVGADSIWKSYRGGVYNACANIGTNHQIVIIGFDLENAKFDQNGNLPPGAGLWKIKNSWGTGWGAGGHMWSKMTSKSGQLCNGLARQAGVVEIPISPPTPTPTLTPTPTPTKTPAPKPTLIP